MWVSAPNTEPNLLINRCATLNIGYARYSKELEQLHPYQIKFDNDSTN